jgi:PIN domain nuclease of toxin-antitoxin system
MARRAFLDTHVAVWIAKGDARLSRQILKDINSHGETVISAISLAELEIKAGIGKIAMPPNLGEVFESFGIKVEPFGLEASQQLARFPSLARHDPFDRLILAQASARLGTTFFTADATMANLEFDWIRSCI